MRNGNNQANRGPVITRDTRVRPMIQLVWIDFPGGGFAATVNLSVVSLDIIDMRCTWKVPSLRIVRMRRRPKGLYTGNVSTTNQILLCTSMPIAEMDIDSRCSRIRVLISMPNCWLPKQLMSGSGANSARSRFRLRIRYTSEVSHRSA